MKYTQVTYLLGAAALTQLPPDEGIEVAFAGRSNAGKSSALNALTGSRSTARTSKTPGRTQLINLFALDESRRLVDLPGYGFAKVSLAVKKQWQATLSQYLQDRTCLQGLVLLMDIRHPLKDTDRQTLAWAAVSNLPVHILLSKADKLKSGARKKTLMAVEKEVELLHPAATVQIFSALKKLGLDQLTARLDHWFETSEPEIEPEEAK